MTLRFFPLLLLSLSASAADHLTLHFVPAPTRTRWNTPQSLAVSAVKNLVHPVNGGARHGIGHAYVELQCGDRLWMTGSTSIGNQDRENVLKHAHGLGVLFERQPGMLEENEAVSRDLEAMHRTGRSTFLEFLISDRACARLERYLGEYRERGYDRVYGNINDQPLQGPGAGCTAFAISFLKVLDLQTSEFESAWKEHRIVPRKFIGGPLTGKRVPYARILFAFGSRWDSSERNGGLPIDFWDPEKMASWTRAAAEDLRQSSGRTFPWPAWSLSKGKSVGILFDVRGVPTPTGPIFQNQAAPPLASGAF